MKYLGIDLGGTNVAAAVVDSEGTILGKVSLPDVYKRQPWRSSRPCWGRTWRPSTPTPPPCWPITPPWGCLLYTSQGREVRRERQTC